MVGLSIATFGFYGSKGPFWSMPPMFMTGTAAAASIAWINSIGNLGGFAGPFAFGAIRSATGSFALALALAGVVLVLSCAVLVFLRMPERAPALAAHLAE